MLHVFFVLLSWIFVWTYSEYSFVTAQVETSACPNKDFGNSGEWVNNGGFALLIFVVIICYWGLSNVSEQYLIPALNVICDNLNLPDDVAGSTIMAIGMQSSTFFQTIASLFVTKSSLGIGSAIGSGFFNPLCICSGAVLCAKDGVVRLEWRIIVRECIFYLVSLLILLWSLKGSIYQAIYQLMGHQQQLGDCLLVHMPQCICIISVYLVYICVCSYYDSIVSRLCPVRLRYGLEFDEHLDSFGSWDHHHLGEHRAHGLDASMGLELETDLIIPPKRVITVVGDGDNYKRPMKIPSSKHSKQSRVEYNYTSLPPAVVDAEQREEDEDTVEFVLNGNSSDTSNPMLPGKTADGFAAGGTNASTSSVGKKFSKFVIWTPWGSGGDTNYSFDSAAMNGMSSGRLLSGDGNVTTVHGGRLTHMASAASVRPDIDICVHEYIDNIDSFQCYLYKRNRFYSKIRYSQHKWQLRWFSLDANGFHYCTNREHPGVGVKFINIYMADEITIVDEDQYIFKIVINGRNYEFQASDEEIFNALVNKLKQRIVQYKQYTTATRTELSSKARASLLVQQNLDSLKEPPTILSLPPSYYMDSFESNISMVGHGLLVGYHYSLLPFKYMLYYTSIDIKQYQYQEHLVLYTALSLLCCLFWLSSLSTVMVICLEMLARFFGISSSLMGLTFSAIVTSVPNITSSITASQKGMGPIAISNAFGCSLFSIFVGLGLPWFIYIVLNDGQPYNNIRDEGIVLTIALLIITLVVFLLLMYVHDFTLKRWMGVVFILYYMSYVSYAIVFTTSEV